MKDRQSSAATRWNLMLLAGRPMALVGCFQILRGLMAFPERGEGLIATGIGLIFFGFVIAWTGKIGKALFYQ
jgi:hypothetical protein